MSLVRPEDRTPPRAGTSHERDDALQALYSRAPRNADVLGAVRDALTSSRRRDEERGDGQ